jgi:hypothetical protein
MKTQNFRHEFVCVCVLRERERERERERYHYNCFEVVFGELKVEHVILFEVGGEYPQNQDY